MNIGTFYRGIQNGLLGIGKSLPVVGGMVSQIQNTIGNVGGAIGRTFNGRSGGVGDYQSDYTTTGDAASDIALNQLPQTAAAPASQLPTGIGSNMTAQAGQAGQLGQAAQAGGIGAIGGQAAQIAPMLV
jgi:hypothetical protein